MNRTMLRSKIHRIRVTERDVEYEGSLTLDTDLMRDADLIAYQKIDVYDVDNGRRFSTYVIEGEAGSGACCVNGAAARLVDVGDKLILASYCSMSDEEAARHRPTVILVGEDNRPKSNREGERAGARARS